MRNLEIIWLMVFLLSCCCPFSLYAGETGKEALTRIDQQLGREQAIGEYIWNALPLLKDTSLATLKNLGPYKEEVLTEPNPYSPSKLDEFRRLYFQGLTLYGRVVDWKHARLLQPIFVEITSPRWVLAKGILVGVPAPQVQHSLGVATSIKRDSLLYQGETDSLEFHLKDGRVTSISIFFYDG